MGIETAIIAAAVIGGGVAIHQSQQAKKEAEKNRKQQKKLAAQNKDRLSVTPKGIARKNARTALVVGSPRGVLSTEDQTATSGRGTLLGN